MLIYLLMIDDPEDRVWFNDLAERYRGLMFSEAYQIVNNYEDAEDAVQKALWKVAEKYKGIRDFNEPQLRGYFVRAAQNHAINMLKQRIRRKEVSLERILEAGLPIDRIKYEEARYMTDDKLAQCILKLPDDYQRVILMRFNDGYTLREIAKELKEKPDTIEKRSQRAIKILKELYENEDEYVF